MPAISRSVHRQANPPSRKPRKAGRVVHASSQKPDAQYTPSAEKTGRAVHVWRTALVLGEYDALLPRRNVLSGAICADNIDAKREGDRSANTLDDRVPIRAPVD